MQPKVFIKRWNLASPRKDAFNWQKKVIAPFKISVNRSVPFEGSRLRDIYYEKSFLSSS